MADDDPIKRELREAAEETRGGYHGTQKLKDFLKETYK